MWKIRNICHVSFCTDIYGEGPIIEIYNGHFEPRRWFLYIRYEGMLKGKGRRPITYPLFKGEGVLLARVDFKWKKVDLFNITVKYVKNDNTKTLRWIRERGNNIKIGYLWFWKVKVNKPKWEVFNVLAKEMSCFFPNFKLEQKMFAL